MSEKIRIGYEFRYLNGIIIKGENFVQIGFIRDLFHYAFSGTNHECIYLDIF